MKNKNQNNTSLFLIIGFFILIVSPNILMLTDFEKKSQFSNLTKFPNLKNESTKSSVVKLKKYYLEHYGFKSTFIDFYTDFKSDFLNENPIPNRVLKGSDGWYFLGNHHNNVLNNTFGMQAYTEIDLHIMKQNLMVLQNHLTDLGIGFYLVVPPNKSTIYKEKLPFEIEERPTPFSQFLATIKPSDSIKVIDLRKVLLDKKDQKQLYLKTDTHWNSDGAYFAYENIMSSLIKDYENQTIVPLSDFRSKKETQQGDITRMINNYKKESTINYNSPVNSNVETLQNKYEYYSFKNDNSSLKLLMYRDSFAYELFPYFNESFKETVYLRYTNNSISKSVIEKEKPDILILQVAERHFDVLLKALRLTK